jgi:hypothetical protein
VWHGTLLGEYSSNLGGEVIEVRVNEAEHNVITNSSEKSSRFLLFLDLQPQNNQPTTYQIVASFEGDSPQNATAYATLPDGTQYAVCTTIQYGFKASSNSSFVTAEPKQAKKDNQT